MTSIHSLGHLQEFIQRATELNRLHEPDHHQEPAASEHATATRKRLAAIHRDFPAAPVHEQAAYLLRGFAALRPFAAGSDLTGWDLVAETLEHHGYDLLAESEDGRELLTALWARTEAPDAGAPDADDGATGGEHLGPPNGTWDDRDETMQWLSAWFRARIVATGVHADIPGQA